MRTTLSTGTPAELHRVQGSSSGLVLIPDIGGLRPLFDDHCARLAGELEMTVCAPEPFPGRESVPVPERLNLMRELDDDRQLADISAAADETGCERVHVLGFCMGGMYALKAVATGRFERAVSFYGMIRVPQQWKGPGQGDPLEALERSGHASRVLALIGGRDQWTPVADVDALEALGAQVVRYPEGEHGFAHDPARPAHRPGDAADAWARATAFLTG